MKNDPLGTAIQDFHNNDAPEDIQVISDFITDDIIPIQHLFREYADFPMLEKIAMENCSGKILDIGAGAGIHTNYLLQKGYDVSTLEISPKAHQYLQEKHPSAIHYLGDVHQFKDNKFDTLLLLMNGIGLAGKYEQIPSFLLHLSQLLLPGGKIICDTTDVSYLYDDSIPLASQVMGDRYFGEFKFQMQYKDHATDWFDWVYLDLQNFKEIADKMYFTLEVLAEEEGSFLIELKNKS